LLPVYTNVHVSDSSDVYRFDGGQTPMAYVIGAHQPQSSLHIRSSDNTSS
jgi:hypothetical protein